MRDTWSPGDRAEVVLQKWSKSILLLTSLSPATSVKPSLDQPNSETPETQGLMRNKIGRASCRERV